MAAEVFAAGRTKRGMKQFPAAGSQLKTPAVILADIGAPVQQADDQHAPAQDSAGFLVGIAHAAAEAVADAAYCIIQFTE